MAKLDALTTVYSYDPLDRLSAVREWRYPWQAATTGVIIYGGNHANKLILSQNIQSPPLSTC